MVLFHPHNNQIKMYYVVLISLPLWSAFSRNEFLYILEAEKMKTRVLETIFS